MKFPLPWPTEAFATAHWFPVDLDVAAALLHFLPLSDRTVADASFMDNRLDLPWNQAQAVSVGALSTTTIAAAAPVGFLFHTSFCCSTLLARALHLGPAATVLREPLVLRRLADARFAGTDIGALLPTVARLLARPWSPGGAVLIKPTHAALSLGQDLLGLLPAARGLVLSSTLEDFLLSNLKKTAETQARVPALVERAMAASDLVDRLGPAAFEPPDFLATVALQWAGQQELIGAWLRGKHGARLRVMQERELLADWPNSVLQVADWYGWPGDRASLAAHAERVGQRHAKAEQRAFDAAQREQEAECLRQQYRSELDRAFDWAQRHLLPAMQSPPLLAAAGL